MLYIVFFLLVLHVNSFLFVSELKTRQKSKDLQMLLDERAHKYKTKDRVTRTPLN